MGDITALALRNGKTMQSRILTYPLSPEDQWTQICLWRTEWKRTTSDYNWLESMCGDYSDTLKIQSVIGTVDGIPAGTASVSYSLKDPEVALVGSVLTHPDFRRLGIAAHLTNAVTDLAFAAGCRVVYLGADRISNCVYQKCGYRWHNAGVMRRAAPDGEESEKQFYSPGQKTTIRPAAWGDMPAFSCLVLQPLDCWVIDYPRGYLSGKHITLGRCVSNFPNVYDQVIDRGGVMAILVGEMAHRVLGFGTLTPGPGPARQHIAVVDVAAHDNYVDQLPKLIENLKGQAQSQSLGVQTLQAFVSDQDHFKKELFLAAGLQPVVELPGRLKVDGQNIDVTLLEGPSGPAK